MRHRPASRLLPVPAARPRPLVQESLQAADERLERDSGASTLDHRTKATTRLRWHSRRQPSSRSGPLSARRSPSSVRRVGRLQGIWAEDRVERPRRSRARRSHCCSAATSSIDGLQSVPLFAITLTHTLTHPSSSTNEPLCRATFEGGPTQGKREEVEVGAHVSST